MSVSHCTVGLYLIVCSLHSNEAWSHTKHDTPKLTAIATLQSGDKCHAKCVTPTEVAIEYISPGISSIGTNTLCIVASRCMGAHPHLVLQDASINQHQYRMHALTL